VWYGLMYYPISTGGNVRFGGLREMRQVKFEAGIPWFPGDFPGTTAGAAWAIREAEKARQDWERRPKGRRVEWTNLDLGAGRKGEIGHGWACDWNRLMQGPDVVNGNVLDAIRYNEAPNLSIRKWKQECGSLVLPITRSSRGACPSINSRFGGLEGCSNRCTTLDARSWCSDHLRTHLPPS
jgi:hypothetical protein